MDLSMAGSTIYFEEDVDQYNTAIGVSSNTFNNIHGYSGTTLMHFKRLYQTPLVEPDVLTQLYL